MRPRCERASDDEMRGAAGASPVIVGISLKAYFGYEQTRRWCAQVATLMADVDHGTGPEIFVLPAFPAIPAALATLAGSGVRVGAQTVSPYPDGPYTGEVSAALLAEIGCTHVAVGHAERRHLFGETSEVVSAQVRAALGQKLRPVICVGELERVDAGTAAMFCCGQVTEALSGAGTEGLLGSVIVAYEPVWAIGAPEPAPEAHIRAVCQSIREQLAAAPFAALSGKVIYGGAAGPGLIGRLGGSLDGLFLGRFAHDIARLNSVIEETRHCLR